MKQLVKKYLLNSLKFIFIFDKLLVYSLVIVNLKENQNETGS